MWLVQARIYSKVYGLLEFSHPQEMGSCCKFDCCVNLGHPNAEMRIVASMASMLEEPTRENEEPY